MTNFYNAYKNNLKNDTDYCRRRRNEMTVSLRKEKRDQAFRSRRKLVEDDVIESENISITTIDDLMTSLSNCDSDVRMAALNYLLGKDEETLQIMLNVNVVNVILQNLENGSHASIQEMSSRILIHINSISKVRGIMRDVNGNARILKMLQCKTELVVENCLFFIGNTVMNEVDFEELLYHKSLLEYVQYVHVTYRESASVMDALCYLIGCMFSNDTPKLYGYNIDILWPIVTDIATIIDVNVQVSSLLTMINVIDSREHNLHLFTSDDISDIIVHLLQSQNGDVSFFALKLLSKISQKSKLSNNVIGGFSCFINKGILKTMRASFEESTQTCLSILVNIFRHFDKDIVDGGFVPLLCDVVRSDEFGMVKQDAIYILGNVTLSKENILEMLDSGFTSSFKDISNEDTEFVCDSVYLIHKMVRVLLPFEDHLRTFQQHLTDYDVLDQLECLCDNPDDRVTFYYDHIINDFDN